MANTDDPSVSDLLTRLRFLLQEPLDFDSRDTETTLAKVRLLSAAALYFNILAVSDFGGRAGPARGEGLVEQAVGAAFQTYGGEDPYPDIFEKAAKLLRGITQGHPFNDGNKRTGFLLACYYLELMGSPMPEHLPVDEVVALSLRVSAGELRDGRRDRGRASTTVGTSSLAAVCDSNNLQLAPTAPCGARSGLIPCRLGSTVTSQTARHTGPIAEPPLNRWG